MDIAGRIRNALGIGQKQNNNSSIPPVNGNDFLKYGNRKQMISDWSQAAMSDIDFYSGYSYAAINNRANKVAQLAASNLKTDALPAIIAAARKSDTDIIHPYLTLIDESDDFTNTEFWYDISTYLDLEGVYYLMAVRNVAPSLVGDIQYFKMLNPYEIKRVRNQTTMEIGGYIETHLGMTREIPKEMIIEIKKLNPFNQDLNFAMTDAAKEYQFTMKQASDYTRSALRNNISAPGIITTDVLLEPEQFQNFQARVTSQEKGMPLFGNGAGAINYEAMQIDMDKAALNDINEISRSTLFAVSGVSKTTMGIEESGTTRDVSKTQKDKFIEDHIMPQLQMIFDALNQDYKRYYKDEYKKNGYIITLDNPLGADKEAELQDVTIAQTSFDLYNELLSSGYESEIAAKYAAGEITLEELGEPTNPPEVTTPTDTTTTTTKKKAQPAEDTGADPDQEDNPVEPTPKDAKSAKSKKKSQQHLAQDKFHHDHEIDLDLIHNAFGDETKASLSQTQAHLENAIQNIEGQVAAEMVAKVKKVKNAFDSQDDLISDSKKKQFETELALIIAGYYNALFPVYADQLMKERAQEFGQEAIFDMTKTIENYIKVTARRASDSHINTIIDDILKSAHDAYEEEVKSIVRDRIAAGSTSEDAFKFARDQALTGASQSRIIADMTTKYQDISKTRAKTIARTETNRAFTQSQFQADLQFLKDTNRLDSAYKVWQTRSEDPCPYCLELEARGPIPFTENFENIGAKLSYDFTKKNGDVVTRTLNIDYEDLEAGNAHVNCQCIYKLVIKNGSGQFIENSFKLIKLTNYNKDHDKDGKFGSGNSGNITDQIVKRFKPFSLNAQTQDSLNAEVLNKDYKNALDDTRKELSHITGAAGGKWTSRENASYIKTIALKNKPQEASPSDYEKMKASGNYITVYRNAGDSKYITSFKNGDNTTNPFHMYGTGVYFAKDKKFASDGDFAKEKPSAIFEALIPKKKLVEGRQGGDRKDLSPDVAYFSKEGKGAKRDIAITAADQNLNSVLTGKAGVHIKANDKYEDSSFPTEQFVITNPAHVVIKGDK